MKIIAFNRVKPSDPQTDGLCETCLCAEACGRYPEDPTPEAMDAWLAGCDRVAASKGGFRACKLADGEGA